MGVTVYQSTDASAPVLSGTVGALITLLDACLVNGYGAKSALGWSKAFSGTNKAAYRTAVGTFQRYTRVDDSNVITSGNAGIASMIGYEAMTSVDAGSGQFPLAADRTFGVGIAKSQTANSTARPWVLVGDEACFYLFVATDGSAVSGAFAGEIVPFKPGDAYHQTVIGTETSSSVTSLTDPFGNLTNALNSPQTNHYMARGYNQVGSAVGFGKTGESIEGTIMGNQGMAYPAAHDNGLYIGVQRRVVQGGVVRGLMPGLYAPLHQTPVPDGTVRTDVANLSGRSVLFKSHSTNTANANIGQIALDITGPWR